MQLLAISISRSIRNYNFDIGPSSNVNMPLFDRITAERADAVARFACNDNVSKPLGDDCEVRVRLDDVIEDARRAAPDFRVLVFDKMFTGRP